MLSALFRNITLTAFAALALASTNGASAAASGSSSAPSASSSLQACYKTCEKKKSDATAYEGCMIECKKADKLSNPAGNATKR